MFTRDHDHGDSGGSPTATQSGLKKFHQILLADPYSEADCELMGLHRSSCCPIYRRFTSAPYKRNVSIVDGGTGDVM
ncbi:unnamed protein product [Gadus morhua 'NCC']